MNIERHSGSGSMYLCFRSPARGLRRFPTEACSVGPVPCRRCADCGNDCRDCDVCRRNDCLVCEVPDLTPRTANTLVVAGRTLAADVTEVMLGSGRAVLLHHLLRTFERLTDELENGRAPRPASLAEQLCLYLMIRHATDLACSVGEVFNTALPYSDYDYYFDRLYDTLLRDDEHMPLIEATKPFTRSGRLFDFDALTYVVSDSTITKLFTPCEPW